MTEESFADASFLFFAADGYINISNRMITNK